MAEGRSVEAIEKDLAQARQRLTENLSHLVSEIHPRVVTHRTISESKRKARQTIDDGKDMVKRRSRTLLRVFKDETGWKLVPLAVASVALIGVIAVSVGKK